MLIGERGAYRLAKPFPSIRVPATVQAVLAARIDRLPAEEKRLLQSAAVIGKDVPLPLLRAIAEVPEDVLQRGLAHLRAAEFLYETNLFPESEYTFKHALTHEVAYASLLQERRRALHGRIVGAIESLHADRLAEQVERLARHALRGEAWEQAVAYCSAAGTKAMARSAFREAATWQEQALEALAHLPESRATLEQAVDLRLWLRNSLQPLGELREVLDHLAKAEVLMEKLGDQRRLIWLWSCMANCYWMIGEHDRGIESGQRAVAAAEAIGDPLLLLGARWNLGISYWGRGDYRRAVTYMMKNQAALEAGLLREVDVGTVPGTSTHPVVGCRANTAWYLAELGDFDGAVASGQAAVQAAEALDQPYSLTLALFHLGGAYFRRGDTRRAISSLERAVGLCQTWNFPFYLPWSAARLGAAYVQAGRVSDGLPLLERTVELDAPRTSQAEISLWCGWLGEAYLAAGRPDDAARLAARALDLAVAHNERGNRAWALRLLGELAARADPPRVEAAAAHYRQARAAAEELEMRPLQAHCHLGLGRLYRDHGQAEAARAELAAAIELYRAMQMSLWLPRAEAELAATR